MAWKTNGYEKYIVQIGWLEAAPKVIISVLAQDILARTRKDGEFLMKFLYPQSIGIEFPYLCKVIEEIPSDPEEEDVRRGELFPQREKIDLIFPN